MKLKNILSFLLLLSLPLVSCGKKQDVDDPTKPVEPQPEKPVEPVTPVVPEKNDDEKLLSKINNILETSEVKPNTMREVENLLKDKEIVLNTITPSKLGNDFIWDKSSNKFLLVKSTELETRTSNSNEWLVVKDEESLNKLTSKYSIYLSKDFTEKDNNNSIEVKGNLDSVNSSLIKTINLNNDKDIDTIDLYTNGEELIINNSNKKIGNINHYGKLNKVSDLTSKVNTYNEYGVVDYIYATDSDLTLKANSSVNYLYFTEESKTANLKVNVNSTSSLKNVVTNSKKDLDLNTIIKNDTNKEYNLYVAKYVDSLAALDEAVSVVDTVYVNILKDLDYRTETREFSVNVLTNAIIDGHDNAILGTADRFSGSPIQASLVVNNGGSKKLDVNIKNLNIETFVDESRCIDTRGKINKIQLDNSKLICFNAKEYKKFSQALTIGGDPETDQTQVELNNSEIITNNISYGIITFNPVVVNINNSYIKAWTSVYVKWNISFRNKSLINVKNSKLVALNEQNKVPNDFGVFALESTDVEINVYDTDIVTTITNPEAGNEVRQSLVALNDFTNEPEKGYVLNVYGNTKVEGFIRDFNSIDNSYQKINLYSGTYSDVECKKYVAKGHSVTGEGPYIIK